MYAAEDTTASRLVDLATPGETRVWAGDRKDGLSSDSPRRLMCLQLCWSCFLKQARPRPATVRFFYDFYREEALHPEDLR